MIDFVLSTLAFFVAAFRLVDVRRALGLAARLGPARSSGAVPSGDRGAGGHLGAIVVRQEHLPALRPADRLDGLGVRGVGAAGVDGTADACGSMDAMGRPPASRAWRPPQWSRVSKSTSPWRV